MLINNAKKLFVLTLMMAAITAIISLSGTTAMAAKAPKLNKTKLELNNGKKKTATLKVKNAGGAKVKWSSSNKKVAKVDKKGKVTAVGKGSAKITAKVGKTSLKCNVKVKIYKNDSKALINYIKKNDTKGSSRYGWVWEYKKGDWKTWIGCSSKILNIQCGWKEAYTGKPFKIRGIRYDISDMNNITFVVDNQKKAGEDPFEYDGVITKKYTRSGNSVKITIKYRDAEPFDSTTDLAELEAGREEVIDGINEMLTILNRALKTIDHGQFSVNSIGFTKWK